MLRRLVLKRFARFRDLTLELGKATVIHGPAESGKTTLFAALRAALGGEAAARRDPDDEPPRLETDGDVAPATPEDVATLLACGDGELCVAGGDQTTAEALSARLRAASIDARALAEEFGRKASTDPSAPHVVEQRQLDERRQAIGAELTRLRAARLELATIDRERAELHEAITELDAEGARRQAALREAEEQRHAQSQERAAARQALAAELAARQEQEQDLAALDQLPAVDPGELAELTTLHGEVESHEQKLRTIATRAEESRQRAAQLNAQLAADHAREPDARRAAGKAAVLGLRLEQFLAQPPTCERQRWRAVRVALSLALWAVAVVSIHQLGWLAHLTRSAAAPVLPYLGLFLGALLGTVGLATARERVRVTDREARERLLAAIAGEWAAARLPPLPGGTADQLRAFFAGQVQAYEQLRHDLDRHAAQRSRVEEELTTILERSRGMLQQTLGARRDAEQAWLAMRRLAGYDQATSLVAQRATLHSRIDARATAFTFAADAAGRAEQLADLEARLAELDRAEQATDPEEATHLAAATRQLEELFTRRQQLHDELAFLDSRAADLAGTLTTTPDRLAEHEQQLTAERLALDERWTQLEVERQTAAAAAVMFAEMAKNERLHLDLLADDARARLAAAGLEGVELSLTALTEHAVRASDADGVLRPLAELSASRRDLVRLALRLSLADKLVGESPRVLLLDEPFLRLCGEWRACAIQLVQQLVAERDWQLVLFTRDQELAATLEALGPEWVATALCPLAERAATRAA